MALLCPLHLLTPLRQEPCEGAPGPGKTIVTQALSCNWGLGVEYTLHGPQRVKTYKLTYLDMSFPITLLAKGD